MWCFINKLQLLFVGLLAVFASPQYLQPQSDFSICHTAYCFEYSEAHEQAKWVSYVVDGKRFGRIKRTNNFRPDLKVKTGSSTLSDFKGSGFDRGHLAPAAVFKWSRKAMSESFLLSNMSPQRPGLNRGEWKHLEAAVRRWAKKEGKLLVTTGPVLKDGLSKIGPSGVSIPNLFFKVVLDPHGDNKKAIGFLLPNRRLSKSFENFAVSVDSVEILSGIDFFPELADSLEFRLEANHSLTGFKGQ